MIEAPCRERERVLKLMCFGDGPAAGVEFAESHPGTSDGVHLSVCALKKRSLTATEKTFRCQIAE